MYRPEIDREQLKELYILKHSFKAIGINKPITRLVYEAIQEFIPKARKRVKDLGGEVLNIDDLE